MGALGAGVGAGVSAMATGVMAGPGTFAVVSRAMVSNAITQGIGVATGLQDHFSWTSVAASGIGAGVGQAVGQGLQNTAFSNAFGRFGVAAASGFVGGAAAALARGGRVSVTQVAVDAFGNAVGSSLVEAAWGGNQRTDVAYSGSGMSEEDYWNAPARTTAQQYADTYGGQAVNTNDRLRLGFGSPNSVDSGEVPSAEYGFVQEYMSRNPDAPVEQVRAAYDQAWAEQSDAHLLRQARESLGSAGDGWTIATTNRQLLNAQPLESGFLRGLSGYQRSVMEPPASGAENIGQVLNGAFTDGVNIIKEPFAEIADIGRLGFQVARSGLGFKAESINPYSLAGSAGASGISYREFFGGIIDGIAGAPGRLVVDGLNGNWNAFGSDLVGMAGFAGALGGLRGVAPFGARNGTVWLDSSSIRQSQQSISYMKKGGYTLDDIARGFAENPSDPRLTIDVVRMRDSLFTSVDNSRPAVLNAMGGGQIQTRIRAFDEPLTAKEIFRFTTRIGDVERVPNTWGAAAEARIWKQGDQFMSLYPNGSLLMPKVTGAPVGSIWSQYNQYPWKR
jgi:hypothetical protein